MDTKEAKEVVTMLANGIDPTTGELFLPDSHYHDPYVIKALFIILGSVRMPAKASKKALEEKQKDNLDNGRPKNAGLPWTEEERREVALLFEAGKTIDDLSEHLERTYGAIKSELTHQRLIQ